MKRVLLILIILTFGLSSYAQYTFYSFYDTIPGSAYGNGNFPQLITSCQDGSFAGVATGAGSRMIFRFDDSGNMIWWKGIYYPVQAFPIAITSLSDSSIAIALHVYGQPSYSIVTKIDLNGNHIWTKKVLNTGSGYVSAITEYGYGGVLITASTFLERNVLIYLDSYGDMTVQQAHGSSLNHTINIVEIVTDDINQFTCVGFITENGNFAIFKADSTGYIYSYREISTPFGIGWGFGSGSQLAKAPDGSHYCLYPADTTGALVLFKFDVADQLEWSKYIYAPNTGIGGECVYATIDNGCMLSTGKYYASAFPRYIPLILKFDENGNLTFSKALGDTTVKDWEHTTISELMPASNNSWMMTAPRYYTFSIFKSDSLFNGFCYNSEDSLNIIDINVTTIPDSIFKVIANFYVDTLTPILSPPLPVFRTDVCTNVGIMDDINVNALMKIFPNPFHDELNISFEDNNYYKIIIYDIVSKKVLEQEFTGSVALNTKPLTDGIYVYDIRSKNGVIKKGKIVKQ